MSLIFSAFISPASPSGGVRRNPVERGRAVSWPLSMPTRDQFKYFHSSPEIIGLAVMLDVRFPLSSRNAEDLLEERSLASRQEFRLSRAAALAEWRRLAAA